MADQAPVCGVAGCGALGRGIAQVAAQAGAAVRLFDARPGAAGDPRYRPSAWLRRRARLGMSLTTED